MAVDNNENLVIETSGLTASVATDVAQFAGVTAHFQLIKLAYGVTGAATVVSSAAPLPVTIATGLTATVSGFTGTMTVQGSGGGAVAVSGTVNAVGLSGSPVFVSTQSGTRVEITGGRAIGKSTDSVSVWGPNGLTYIYAHMVNSNGTAIGIATNPMYVNVMGATINAIINPTVGVTNSASSPLFVCGVSGATAVNVTVGNTLGINDTAMVSGLCGIYGQLLSLNLGLATAMPSTLKTGRTSSAYPSVVQLDSGFTCGKGVSIKALSTNTDFIYIGNTGTFTGSSTGHALDPGDDIFLAIENLNKIYIVSGSSTQTVTYIAS